MTKKITHKSHNDVGKVVRAIARFDHNYRGSVHAIGVVFLVALYEVINGVWFPSNHLTLFRQAFTNSDILGTIISLGFETILCGIITWYILLSVFLRADNHTLVNEFERLRPHVKMLTELEQTPNVPYTAMLELKKLFLEHKDDCFGPLSTINTIDTMGPYAWISNGVLQYEGILSLWAKRASIECSLWLGAILITDKLGDPFSAKFKNKSSLCIKVGHSDYQINGRIERIFIWPLSEITSKLGSTILGFHTQRGHPSFILPIEWVDEEIADFVIWDVSSSQLCGCKTPRPTDEDDDLVYGFEKRPPTDELSTENSEVGWDYVGIDRRNELASQWKKFTTLAVPVSHIDRSDTNARTLATKIEKFDYHKYKKNRKKEGPAGSGLREAASFHLA